MPVSEWKGMAKSVREVDGGEHFVSGGRYEAHFRSNATHPHWEVVKLPEGTFGPVEPIAQVWDRESAVGIIQDHIALDELSTRPVSLSGVQERWRDPVWEFDRAKTDWVSLNNRMQYQVVQNCELVFDKITETGFDAAIPGSYTIKLFDLETMRDATREQLELRLDGVEGPGQLRSEACKWLYEKAHAIEQGEHSRDDALSRSRIRGREARSENQRIGVPEKSWESGGRSVAEDAMRAGGAAPKVNQAPERWQNHHR